MDGKQFCKVLLFTSILLIHFANEGKTQDFWREAQIAYGQGDDLRTISLLDSVLYEIHNIEGVVVCGNGIYAISSSVAILMASAYLRLGNYRACREAINIHYLGDGYQEAEADSIVLQSIINQYGYRKGKKLLRKETLNCKLIYNKYEQFVYFVYQGEDFKFNDISYWIEEFHKKNGTFEEGFESYWRKKILKRFENISHSNQKQ